MRELGLFEQYLMKLRQEKLQQAHAWAIATTGTDYTPVRIIAHEAQLCERMLTAIRALNNDAGSFIKEYLKQ